MPVSTLSCLARIRGYRGHVSDSFTRADSALALGTADSGHVWNLETGAAVVYGIAANRPWRVSGTAGDNRGYSLNTLVSDNIIVEARLRIDIDLTVGLIYRGDGAFTASNKFICDIRDNAGVYQVRVRRVTAGTATSLYDAASVIPLVQDQFVTLRVQLLGSDHVIWLDDVVQTTVTSASHLTNTRAGIIISPATWDGADDFAVRQIGGSPDLSMGASVLNRVERPLSMKAAIHDTEVQTVSLKAAITDQDQKTLSMKALILSRVVILETIGDNLTVAAPPDILPHAEVGDFSVTHVSADEVFIWELFTQFSSNFSRSLTLRASILNRVPRTVSMKAFITNRISNQIQMRCRIRPVFSRTIRMRAKILGRTVRTIRLRAKIEKTTSRTISMRARIRRIEFPIQMRARIQVTGTSPQNQRVISLRAAMTPQELRRIDMKASIRETVEQTLSMLARVQPFTDLSMKARIHQALSAALEVTYHIQVPVDVTLTVRYNASDMVRTSTFISVKAKIVVPVEAALPVTWSVDYPIPSDCIHHPTQRIEEE